MKRLFPLLLLMVALVAAGCAGRGEATGSGDEAADREEALLAFTECMREHGIDMPDPETREGGRGGIFIQRAGGSDQDREELDEAREACEEHLEGTFQEMSPEDRAEFQDKAVEFAACMRDHGIDMPDPDFSDAGPGMGGFRQRIAGFDPDDPDFQEADEECRVQVWGADGGPGMVRFARPGR